MWYVIQTISGQEHEVCLWINTYVDKTYYTRCFVPLYEDVWRKEGVGHISIKKMFSGYIFLETDTPEKVHDALKEMPKLTVLLSVKENTGRVFLPIHKYEESFFDNILSDGIMRVSYVHVSKSGKLDMIIGPLRAYEEQILRVDIPHRRAIVVIPMLGEERSLKFGLWLDKDPKIDWIEEEKTRFVDTSKVSSVNQERRPDNIWDWKEWKKINEEKRNRITDEDIFGYKVGDYVINTTGIYGDIPLQITEIRSDKNTVTVNVELFGRITGIEMEMDKIMKIWDAS